MPDAWRSGLLHLYKGAGDEARGRLLKASKPPGACLSQIQYVPREPAVTSARAARDRRGYRLLWTSQISGKLQMSCNLENTWHTYLAHVVAASVRVGSTRAKAPRVRFPAGRFSSGQG